MVFNFNLKNILFVFGIGEGIKIKQRVKAVAMRHLTNDDAETEFIKIRAITHHFVERYDQYVFIIKRDKRTRRKIKKYFSLNPENLDSFLGSFSNLSYRRELFNCDCYELEVDEEEIPLEPLKLELKNIILRSWFLLSDEYTNKVWIVKNKE